MVTFDAQHTVTSASEWAAVAAWDDVPGLDIDAFCRAGLLVWSAHPDDETLGAGGLIAEAASRGFAVHVVVATGDEARMGELRAALGVLHPDATLTHLGLPDGALGEHRDELSQAIEKAMDAFPQRSILCPWSNDRHGDHRALGQLVGSGARQRRRRVFSFPVWLWQWGEPDDVPWADLVRVPVAEQSMARKQAAIDAFASQLHGPSPVLPGRFLEWARHGAEVLVLEPSDNDAHFEQVHKSASDPWGTRERWYERRKRAILLATLPRERYGSVLELGCSIGATTRELAGRADAVLAIDGAFAAVHAARENTRFARNVRVERLRLPHQWPEGDYDLVVVSEVAYYFAPEEWRAVCAHIARSLRPGGEVVACHWTGLADDFAQSVPEIHSALAAAFGTAPALTHSEPEFELAVYRERTWQQ